MEIAETDGAGNITMRYIPGPGVDQRVAMVAANGDTHFYHADRLGNVIALADTIGAVTDQYLYSPFGVETVAAASGNPFRYTGRRYDPETGLYFYRARYYDPVQGRFLETDPVGYADQMNLYAYCGNDGVNCTDPTGRQMYPDDEGGSLMDFFVDKIMEKTGHAAANSGVTALNETIDSTGTLITGQDCCVPDIPAPFPETDPLIQDITDVVIVSAAEIAAARVGAGKMQPSVRSSKWQLGSNHSATRWSHQMESRGWTSSQIDEAIASGQQFRATNNINSGNGATRYVHPQTGRSVVRDDVTGDVIHIGGDDYRYE